MPVDSLTVYDHEDYVGSDEFAQGILPAENQRLTAAEFNELRARIVALIALANLNESDIDALTTSLASGLAGKENVGVADTLLDARVGVSVSDYVAAFEAARTSST